MCAVSSKSPSASSCDVWMRERSVPAGRVRWRRDTSSVQVFVVDQGRHVLALVNDAKNHRCIMRRRDPREEDCMPSTVDRAQPRRKQASVAPTVGLVRNPFERLHQASGSKLQPLARPRVAIV